MLSIGEEDTALVKAAESGDTDLVYLVLFHIMQKVFCKLRMQLLFKFKQSVDHVIISPFSSPIYIAETSARLFWDNTG